MARRLVYKVMFGGYDLVLPPVAPTPECDFVLITDDADLIVDGWRTMSVTIDMFKSPKHANLYYRSCISDILPGYDQSLYTDANIRILNSLDELFERFTQSGAGLGAYRHPLRNTVADEIQACLDTEKVIPCAALDEQIAFQNADGFPDTVGLIETTIMMQNHNDPVLQDTMRLWNDGFQKFGTRDQFGLPYAIWKTGLSVYYQDHNFRNPNPWFGLYPHLGAKNVNPHYVQIAARAYDSPVYALLKNLWHAQWAVKRRLRSTKSQNQNQI